MKLVRLFEFSASIYHNYKTRYGLTLELEKPKYCLLSILSSSTFSLIFENFILFARSDLCDADVASATGSTLEAVLEPYHWNFTTVYAV